MSSAAEPGRTPGEVRCIEGLGGPFASVALVDGPEELYIERVELWVEDVDSVFDILELRRAWAWRQIGEAFVKLGNKVANIPAFLELSAGAWVEISIKE